jgi:hypothetical protein
MAMKLIFARLSARVFLCFAPLGFAQFVLAHECTLSDAAGKYGYTSSGTIVNPAVGPFTAVGHVTLSEAGTFTGAQTTSIAGNLLEETVQGTFTVNPDCTGVGTASVFHGTTLARTSVFNLVWDNHQSEFRAVFLTPGTNISIQGRKMAAED